MYQRSMACASMQTRELYSEKNHNKTNKEFQHYLSMCSLITSNIKCIQTGVDRNGLGGMHDGVYSVPLLPRAHLNFLSDFSVGTNYKFAIIFLRYSNVLPHVCVSKGDELTYQSLLEYILLTPFSLLQTCTSQTYY